MVLFDDDETPLFFRQYPVVLYMFPNNFLYFVLFFFLFAVAKFLFRPLFSCFKKKKKKEKTSKMQKRLKFLELVK